VDRKEIKEILKEIIPGTIKVMIFVVFYAWTIRLFL
jgi:hypothetical protein|tara:strand:+ start:396 stop:503 length:108 start_codon:yes stop_codon:yes gene_type:complete